MTTKITIDPALVREVLKKGRPRLAMCEIEIFSDERIYIQDISHGYGCRETLEVIDIHRFKDLAIEWCAGKGWGISRWDDGTAYVKGPSILDRPSVFYPGPTRLFAELAAISFVWEQIQKEEKNER